jgi:Tfp pilus assembly protein PilO
MILAIVGALIVCALFFFLFIRSRQGELREVRETITAEEDRAIQLTAELNRLKDLQRRAPELQAELTKIRELVPIEHELPNYIFLVQDAATEAGVDFVALAPELPKAPPEGAPLAEVRMAIDVNGGFFSIQDFLRRVYAVDRATRIDNLSLGIDEEGGGLVLSMSTRIFFELPAAPDAATGADPNVAPPTAPVATPGTTP